MRIDSSILGLPACLLYLLATHPISIVCDNEPRTPWRNEAQTNGEAPHAKDSRAIEQVSIEKKPMGVMKMSDDPGEKFFFEYWQYEEESMQTESNLRARDGEGGLVANISTILAFQPPFMLHTDDESFSQDLRARGLQSRYGAAAAKAALEKRAFTCPTGTSDCSSIGAPNACCVNGETCFSITNTGLGSVGCCPDGASCGDTIDTCNFPNTPCAAVSGANYQPGGCCIPNYVCAGVGCVINPTMVVTVVVTQTFTSESSTQTSTSTSTVTPSTTTTASTTSTISTTSTTSERTSSSSSASTVSTTTATSATGVAPVRPTTESTSSTPTSTLSGTCPTGFYACSAYYQGGCCQTGRNCDTTSCPPTSSTSIVSGQASIVVPVDSAAGIAAPSGACASGWSSCAASVGGNCCPSGWQCQTASCVSANPSQTNVLQKASPSDAGSRSQGSSGVILATIMCLTMIYLSM